MITSCEEQMDAWMALPDHFEQKYKGEQADTEKAVLQDCNERRYLS